MDRYPEYRLGLVQRIRAECLYRFLAGARAWKGARGPVPVRSEFHHEHGPSLYWNESFYFNFTDPSLRIGGFTRIGMMPNQKSAVGILFVFLEDGSILMLHQSEPIEAGRDDVAVGKLRYERVRPLWEWRIRFDGNMLRLADPRDLLALTGAASPASASQPRVEPSSVEVNLDLAFSGWSGCHDFKKTDLRFFSERFVSKGSRLKDLRAVGKVASEHYEQVGDVVGTIALNSRTLAIRGSGHRDHSWGERDWKAPERWTWLTAQFGREFAFNLSRVVIRSLDIFNGYVCRRGRNYALRRAHLETEFEADETTQKRVRVRLEDASGWEADVDAEVLTVVPLTLAEGEHRTRVNEGLASYRWEGREGLGIAEYLHQVR